MIKAFLNELEDGVGKFLFHYTDINGLYGILENNNIRCTHISYLNDHDEFFHGLEIFNEVLQKYDNGQPGLEKFKNRFKIDKLSKNPEEFKLAIEKFNIYVFSLSAEKDDLNQWRSYSNGDDGYSILIRFDSEYFNSQINRFKEIESNDSNYLTLSIVLKKCVYDYKKRKRYSKKL